MRWLSLRLIFKILMFLVAIDVLNAIYFLIFPFSIDHPFNYFGFSNYILWGVLKTLFLYAVVMFLCIRKNWIVFPLILLMNGCFLFVKVPIAGYPALWLSSTHVGFGSKVLILRMLIEILMAIVGILIVLKQHYKSGKI